MPRPWDRNLKYSLLRGNLIGVQIDDADINDPDIDGGTLDDSDITDVDIAASRISESSARLMSDVSSNIFSGPPTIAFQGSSQFQDVYGGSFQIASAYQSWESKWVDLTSARPPATPITRIPDFVQFLDDGASSRGIYSFAFDPTQEQELHFSFHLPNSYKPGTDIYAHVHWSPSDSTTGVVRWGMECTWQNVDAAFPSTSFSYAAQQAAGVIAQNQKIDLPAHSGSGKEIDSVVICRLFRDATSGTDTYTADVFAHGVGIDYQLARFGTATREPE
jgi:hypothetical protein